MRRLVIAVLAGLLIAAAGLAVRSSVGQPAGARAASSNDLTVWVGWGTRELSVFKSVVAVYQRAHPNVHVNVIGNINDNKIVAAIRAGNAPDVASSFNSYNVGVYCGTGGWIDLGPMLKQAHISAAQFPPATNYYTQFKGKRCALPLLADTYGLYYNKQLFKAAGIKRPPRTISELTADAKKLTKRDKKGNIKVAGLDPFIGFYENVPERWITQYGGKWLDQSKHSILSKQPAWSKWLRWQRRMINWYGYGKLVRFQAGLRSEEHTSELQSLRHLVC